ncbi:hypothetical protein KIN20_015755 [Parelaphostrongylus tenuis]|uniref:Uncharacterized protein n=1 Tax=Parelaphostrongylus tenuis TaxID=148309 RepID=A0AAD5QQ45_PARTN|nr:hypothetical protein KIN20_015755 [Parelaphostrongylus tenuis]
MPVLREHSSTLLLRNTSERIDPTSVRQHYWKGWKQDYDEEFNKCLMANTKPFSDEQMKICDSDALRSARRFSFGRTITYMPTRCFTGIEIRRKNGCGRVLDCCPAVEIIRKDDEILEQAAKITCKMLNELSKGRMRGNEHENNLPNLIILHQTTFFLWHRMMNGLEIKSLPLPSGYVPAHPHLARWAPSGYVNVHYNGVVKDRIRKGREFEDGHAKVGFITNDEGNDGRTKFTEPQDDIVENHGNHTKVLPSFGLEVTDKPAPALRNKCLYRHACVQRLPEDGRSAVEDRHEKDKSVKIHGAVVEQAVKDADQHKETVKKKNTVEAIRKSFDSLLKAEQVLSEVDTTKKAIPSKTVVFGSVEKAEPTASGSVRSLDILTDDIDYQQDAHIVTSAPVIFAANASISEIKEMTDHWHEKVKLLSENEKATKLEIMNTLAEMIEHFEQVNLQLFNSTKHSAINSTDPRADGVRTFARECSSLVTNNKANNSVENIRKGSS